MSASSLRTYQRSFGGGAPCRVVEIRTDRLDAHRLQAPSRVRARDAAHVLVQQTGLSVETLALPSLAVSARSAPAGLRQHGHDAYPTLRSALSAWWARTEPTERAVLLQQGRGDVPRFVAALRRRGLVATHRHAVDGAQAPLQAFVGTLGHLRQAGQFQPNARLLNTHFFLFDPRELDSPLAAIGDPVGMLATNGQIRFPPILRRATLLHAGGRWQVRHVGAEDLAIDLPDGTTLRPGVPDGPLLRYRGRDPDGPTTRGTTAACEIWLQGRSVTLIRCGGDSPTIPHGALVLAFPTPPAGDLLRALEAQPSVAFRIPRLPDLVTALQAGPQLLRDGAIVLSHASFREERFRTLGTPDPTAPLDFPANPDRTRAARVGIGVTRANTLVILAVQGTSSLAAAGPHSPTGCTLLELAEALIEAGAVDALNCDGGGSAQVFSGSGVLLPSGDARGVPGALFDRPVPVAAYLT